MAQSRDGGPEAERAVPLDARLPRAGTATGVGPTVSSGWARSCRRPPITACWSPSPFPNAPRSHRWIGRYGATSSCWVPSPLLAFAAAALGGHQFIRRPVAQLSAAAARLHSGDLSARAALPDQHSELGRLGATFDGMAGALEERERDLRRSEELFRQFAENLPEVVWVEDAASGPDRICRPGLRCDLAAGGRGPNGQRSIGSRRPRRRPAGADRGLRSGPGWGVPPRRSTGSRGPTAAKRWLHSTAFPIHDPDGAVVRVGRITRDITEQR